MVSHAATRATSSAVLDLPDKRRIVPIVVYILTASKFLLNLCISCCHCARFTSFSCSIRCVIFLQAFIMADAERKTIPGDAEDTTLEHMGYQPGSSIQLNQPLSTSFTFKAPRTIENGLTIRRTQTFFRTPGNDRILILYCNLVCCALMSPMIDSRKRGNWNANGNTQLVCPRWCFSDRCQRWRTSSNDMGLGWNQCCVSLRGILNG